MNKHRFLAKIQNNNKNVRYNDFITLIESFGFRRVRGKGSHNVYECIGVPEMINIQNDNGQVKPYKVRQFLSILERYNLKMEGKDNE